MYLTFKYVDMSDQGLRLAAKSRTGGGQYNKKRGNSRSGEQSRSRKIDHGPANRVL